LSFTSTRSDSNNNYIRGRFSSPRRDEYILNRPSYMTMILASSATSREQGNCVRLIDLR